MGDAMKHLESALVAFASRVVDQRRARVIVAPKRDAPGFWFGGGNLMLGPDGHLYLVGRYRNAGDSRIGLSAGERGAELAIFRSRDRGRSFERVLSFAKADLDMEDRWVLSIEGSALHWTPGGGVELFVSSEKDGVGYPPGFEDYIKPSTGVWSIDRLAAASIDALPAAPRETILASEDPRFLHVKDPFVHATPAGDLVLLFCTHPYCWTSSNTAYAIRRRGRSSFEPPVFEFFPRGTTWDVAITRGTCVLDVPPVGALAGRKVSLLFYDGGECVRDHDEHRHAVHRARGHSCEELGGAAYLLDGDFTRITRLSAHRPLFVSPHGTGCSRYVDVLAAPEGFYATWQQSQPDGSQPLVMNFLPLDEAQRILQADELLKT
jgi:hypothetical protein